MCRQAGHRQREPSLIGSYKTSIASLGIHRRGEPWDRRKPGSSMIGNRDTLNALRTKPSWSG